MSDWPVACDILIDELSAAAPLQVVGVRKWIDCEEQLWRVDRVLAEVSILSAQGQHDDAAKLLADSIFNEQIGMTARDQALWTDRPESRIVGSAIAELADPVRWFTDSWNATFEARERA